MQIIIVQYPYGAYVKKAPRNKLLSDSLHINLGSLGVCHETAKTNSFYEYVSHEPPAINYEPAAGHLALAKATQSLMLMQLFPAQWPGKGNGELSMMLLF